MSILLIAVSKVSAYKDMPAMLRAQRISAFPVLVEHNKVIALRRRGDLPIERPPPLSGAVGN
jgi:hypothetical protein